MMLAVITEMKVQAVVRWAHW